MGIFHPFFGQRRDSSLYNIRRNGSAVLVVVRTEKD